MNKAASISVYIDRYHPKKDGKCAVSIRVTFDRKKRYYPLPFDLFPKDFDRIINAKRRTEAENGLYNRIRSFLNKAIEAADLQTFTFDKFEDKYLTNRDAANIVSDAFDVYIKDLIADNRIGTATSYESAKNSLSEFKPGLRFADVTPVLLRKYEAQMISQGKSKTTVGIYLRSLRAIYNRANIDKSLYPFGENKGKYSIPTGRNIKKSLSMEDIGKIFTYKPENTFEDRAKDYWIFLYLCNGINVKDFCLLRHKDIEGDVLTYERAKTKRSKRGGQNIQVSLKPRAKQIIQKWSLPSLNPDTYLFPHLNRRMNAVEERKVYQQLTQNINKNMKRIASKLGITKPVSTYSARHSFATILKRSGANVEFISDALGHGNIKTTSNYLAGFETETIHKITDALIPKAANE